jgi:hypothetical protein
MRIAGVPRLALTLCALVLTTTLRAAEPLQLDLAGAKSGATVSANVDPGTYVVSFVNLLPTRSYTITVQHVALPPDPLPLVGIPWLKAGAAERSGADPCDGVRTTAKKLADATAEAQVPDALKALAAALETKLCKEQDVTDAGEVLVARTSRQYVVSVAPGEKAVVQIQRGEVDATHPAGVWSLALSSGPSGQWLTSYGFMVGKNHDERYFAKSAPDAKFAITKERDVPAYALIPAVFFSWQSQKAVSGEWAFSPTIGLGATSDTPAFLGGLSATFHGNLGIVAGVGLSKQKRLSGQYVPDQIVSENLKADQLSTSVWRPGFMIAGTLRFSSNPFGGNTTPAKPAPPPAVPAPVTPAAPAKPETPKPGTESSPTTAMTFSTNGYRLFFTEAGDLRAVSTTERDRLLSALGNATDVFVLSHGWWNSPESADCRYQQLMDGLRAHLPASLQDPFRPIVVGLYWPSVVFPTETGDCAPAVPTPHGAELMVQGSFESDLRAWAPSAFPSASQSQSFGTDLSRFVELLNRERKGQPLSRNEAVELASLLDRWRRASPHADAGGTDGPGEELFTADPATVIDNWLATPGNNTPLESLTLSKILDFANAFTFWTMKERAGLVGSRGVFDLVHALRERGGSAIRIHLIGHSFGGRVVAAAVAGRANEAPNQVDSLIILEGAFSHFAFSSKDQIAAFGFAGNRSGLFERAVSSLTTAAPAIRGRLVAVFSDQDLPNRLLYPQATRLKGDDREANRVAQYGSIGADGIKGPAAGSLSLERASADMLVAALQSGGRQLFNVDATNVIRGHSDLMHDQVFDLIWAAILAGRTNGR